MTVADAPITISLPRSIVEQVINVSASFTDKLHALLERNTAGLLSADEKSELEALVHISQFNQIVSLALQLGVPH